MSGTLAPTSLPENFFVENAEVKGRIPFGIPTTLNVPAPNLPGYLYDFSLRFTVTGNFKVSLLSDAAIVGSSLGQPAFPIRETTIGLPVLQQVLRKNGEEQLSTTPVNYHNPIIGSGEIPSFPDSDYGSKYNYAGGTGNEYQIGDKVLYDYIGNKQNEFDYSNTFITYDINHRTGTETTGIGPFATTYEYTNDYVLFFRAGVNGFTIPSSTDTNENPGRFLVAWGDPRGQRGAAWGAWLDTISADPGQSQLAVNPEARLGDTLPASGGTGGGGDSNGGNGGPDGGGDTGGGTSNPNQPSDSNNPKAVSVNLDEMAKLANDAYYNKTEGREQDEQDRGWTALTAAELHLPQDTQGRQGTIAYTFEDGVYNAGSTDDLKDGATAHVLTAIVDGAKTVVVAFRGSSQFGDFAEVPDTNSHYAKFKPLTEAVKAYIQSASVGQVLVTGHSLGGAMTQEFVRELDDANLGLAVHGVTFANIGTQRGGTLGYDVTLLNVMHTEDVALTLSGIGLERLGVTAFVEIPDPDVSPPILLPQTLEPLNAFAEKGIYEHRRANYLPTAKNLLKTPVGQNYKTIYGNNEYVGTNEYYYAFGSSGADDTGDSDWSQRDKPHEVYLDSGDDTFKIDKPGGHLIDGGNGVQDTVIYSGAKRDDYDITVSGPNVVVARKDGEGDRDLLRDVEFIVMDKVAEVIGTSAGPVTRYESVRIELASLRPVTFYDDTSSDSFVGGAGRDVLKIAGARRGATFSLMANDQVSVAHSGQVDTIRNFEEIRFIDGRMVFDAADPAAAVTRLYQGGLGRPPDQGQLNFWIASLQSGTPLSDLASSFEASDEFTARFGAGLTNTDFVTRIYQNVLGRAPEAGGLEFWRGNLDSNTATRGQTLAGISESAENKAVTAPLLAAGIWDVSETAAQVARLYDTALGRLPDAAGLSFWVSAIDNGGALAELANSFVDSPEFRATYGVLDNRGFVSRLYENTLHRPADAGGLDFWTGRLSAGASRAQVTTGFSESAEHQANTMANIMSSDPGNYGIKLAG